MAVSDNSALAHDKAASLARKLEQLGNAFASSLDSRVKEVRRIWTLIPETPRSDEARDALIKIHDIAHTLAGSGKSFGFPAVSVAAAPLDGLFRLLREQTQSLSREEIAQIELLVQGLERATLMPRVPVAVDDIVSAAMDRGDARILLV
ncbi:MAG: Hpt domain-containing protein, partial [Alphaproteobacteria bacterium]|nr:Hpt domain-containing protein [Alphaproteobacteria bacterium]